jgi:hypothetical protein
MLNSILEYMIPPYKSKEPVDFIFRYSVVNSKIVLIQDLITPGFLHLCAVMCED